MTGYRLQRTLTYPLLIGGTLLWGLIESLALLRARCCDRLQRDAPSSCSLTQR